MSFCIWEKFGKLKTWKFMETIKLLNVRKTKSVQISWSMETNLLNTNTLFVTRCNTGNLKNSETWPVDGHQKSRGQEAQHNIVGTRNAPLRSTGVRNHRQRRRNAREQTTHHASRAIQHNAWQRTIGTMKTNEKKFERKATQAQQKHENENENISQQNGEYLQLQLAGRRPFVVGPALSNQFR